VSDKASFCHHCGLRLAPEMAARDVTTLRCPACQDDAKLVSRQIGQIPTTVMECPRCTGMWLGVETFSHITQQAADAARTVASSSDPRTAAARHARDNRGQSGSFYRPCPVCRQLMPRKNYRRYSGVIIDHCKEHGVWFDANELPQILAWIRAGGLAEAQRRDALEQQSKAVQNRIAKAGSRPNSGAGMWQEDESHDSFGGVAGAAIDLLSHLFRF
jgi:Zn-finger nucleic acid-binding protein